MIDVWYPACIDTINGGYFSDFTYDWILEGPQDKFIVTQARHVWSLSFLYEKYDKRDEFLKWAGHGVHFLKNNMWDHEYGGFYQLTDDQGQLKKGLISHDKKAYGNAFAIYALAQYYKVSNDTIALELAKKTFHWLDENSRDNVHGGYFEFLHRDGTPIDRKEMDQFQHSERLQIGLKDYNSSIHLLEAFTTLYQVWPDSLVRERLAEMFDVVTNKMYDERGFLKLYFHADWIHVSDDVFKEINATGRHFSNHITFGHDVETAFLIYEAARVLGMEEGQYMGKIKLLVDHPLSTGWDKGHGGFFDQGKYINGQVKIIYDHKEWWGQAEAMNSFLLMDGLFPGDSKNYYQKFEEQWKYIDSYLIDHVHGGWYINGLDVSEKYKKANKASIWKGNYHTIRAMVHCLERLEGSN